MIGHLSELNWLYLAKHDTRHTNVFVVVIFFFFCFNTPKQVAVVENVHLDRNGANGMRLSRTGVCFSVPTSFAHSCIVGGTNKRLVDLLRYPREIRCTVLFLCTLPPRMGYCSNTNRVRRFRFEDNNVSFMNMQAQYYCVQQVEPCH